MNYYYGMRERGCAPGCQPGDGFVMRLDAGKDTSYFDIIKYDRMLTLEEENHYGLTRLMASDDNDIIEDTTVTGLVSDNIEEMVDKTFTEIERLMPMPAVKVTSEEAKRIAKAEELLTKAMIEVVERTRFIKEEK